MKYNSVIISTTGAPGSGKSYSRCARFLVDWYIPHEKFIHYSNFPINFEALQAKFPDIDVRERVKVIPEEELKAWLDYDTGRGPWSYFPPEMNIEHCHFALDECHRWIPKDGEGNRKNAKRWGDWLREIRHRKCSVEFLTQDPQQVNKIIEVLTTVRIQLMSSADRRDPIFSVLMGDWYEVVAYFSGTYEDTIWQVEEKRVLGKWKQGEIERFKIDPYYYQFYNSYNAQITTDSQGSTAADEEKVEVNPREFQKRGRVGFWFWFFRRNAWRFAIRAVAAVALFWLCFGGGFSYGITKFVDFIRQRGSAPSAAKGDDVKPKADASSVSKESKLVAVVEPQKQKIEVPVVVPVPIEPKKIPSQEINVPVNTVRSETLAHRNLEAPVSAEQQQKAVSRLVLLNPEFLGLDDGQIVFIGDKVGEWSLTAIEYSRRRAVFTEGVGDAISHLVVPVGGPIGLRVPKKPAEGSSTAGSGSLSGILPAIKPD